MALALPSTHVFEGMRAILVNGTYRPDLMVNAVLLDVAFLAVGAVLFLAAFHAARVRGLLLQIGE